MAQGVKLFVDISVKEGDNTGVDSKSNFDPENKRIKECLEFKKLLVSTRPNPKDII